MNWNTDVELGGTIRCRAFRCVVCGRTDVYPARDGAERRAREAGWQQTDQLGGAGERPWVCSKHHDPDGDALYVDKVTDQRPPQEVYDDL